MPQFEAVFSDGMVATFEADSMKVDDGLVVLERRKKDRREVVVAISPEEMLFIRNTNVEVELIEDDDWEDEDEWEEEDDDEEEADAPGATAAPASERGTEAGIE